MLKLKANLLFKIECLEEAIAALETESIIMMLLARITSMRAEIALIDQAESLKSKKVTLKKQHILMYPSYKYTFNIGFNPWSKVYNLERAVNNVKLTNNDERSEEGIVRISNKLYVVERSTDVQGDGYLWRIKASL